MTPQKALDLLEYVRVAYINDRCCYESVDEEVEAIDYAINLVKKEIPEKVIRVDWCPTRCPACNADLSNDHGDGYYSDKLMDRCPDCNQLLDWAHPESKEDETDVI